MAKHKTTEPSNLSLTWSRLSSPDLWSWGLVLFVAISTAVATYLMDYLRTENGSWLWLITYFSTLVLATALAFMAKKWILPRVKERLIARVNLLLAAVIGGVKNLSVGLLAMMLQLEARVGLLYRFVGGVLMGVALIALYSAMTGSKAAHTEAIKKLNAIRNDLLGSKENLDVLLADELEHLVEKSRETVLPKIAQISLLLKSQTETSQIVAELNETVSTRVRPLMNELSLSAKSGLLSVTESTLSTDRVQTPRSFVARELIKPLTYLAYSLPAVCFLAFYFQGLEGALFGAISSLSFAGLMWLLRAFVFPRRATGRVLSYAMLTVAAIGSPVFGLYVLGGALPMSAHQSVLLPFMCWLVYISTVVVLSPVILLDTESRKLEKLIEVENTELAKEIAVFEQKLWVFNRRWLFMLHGTVQSALTAALTRLQTFAESDPYQVSLVQADLERAEAALKSVPSNDIDFDNAATELKESWAGVCAITVKVDMRATRALATNKGTAYCVNEILKEAIGNAVRHGSATAVMVNITREEDDFVDVEIQNDGSAPPKRRKKGIGSRMLDDITLNWSLSRSGRLTTLTARLPL